MVHDGKQGKRRMRSPPPYREREDRRMRSPSPAWEYALRNGKRYRLLSWMTPSACGQRMIGMCLTKAVQEYNDTERVHQVDMGDYAGMYDPECPCAGCNYGPGLPEVAQGRDERVRRSVTPSTQSDGETVVQRKTAKPRTLARRNRRKMQRMEQGGARHQE